MAAQINVSITSNKDEYKDELNRVARKILTMWGMQGESSAKEFAPVDTGNLRNSITYDVDADDRSVTIGTNVEYAPYQELGTSKMKAHPFLRPAIEGNIDRFNDILKSELKKGS